MYDKLLQCLFQHLALKPLNFQSCGAAVIVAVLTSLSFKTLASEIPLTSESFLTVAWATCQNQQRQRRINISDDICELN